MSNYTDLAKISISNGNYLNALLFVSEGLKANDPPCILIVNYLDKEIGKKSKKEILEKVLPELVYKYCDFDINTVFMPKDEFERKKDSLSEMLYIRYIYMEINEGKIVLDASNYKKMDSSRYGFKRFSQIIDSDVDKKEFDFVIRDNEAFLRSIKKSLFGSVYYDKALLQKVFDGITNSYNKFYTRLSDEQQKELGRQAQIKHNIGSVIGGGFIFTGE